MIRTYAQKRKRQSRELSHVGDLRLSAKQISGAGLVEPYPGFLYCNGLAISRADYKRLFDLIGTAYGVGDGSTTFNLPDFRGRFLAGITDAAAAAIQINALIRGGILGAEVIALGKANIPVHNHDVGTLNVGASGSHSHGPSGGSATKNTAASNDFAFWAEFAPVSTRVFTGGSFAASTHTHPNGEWSGGTGDGSSAGESSLAAANHQNVHSHQAIGGVLVSY
jgi:microcystin-dependent protein